MTHPFHTSVRRAAAVMAATAALSGCFDPALAQVRSVQPAAQPAPRQAQTVPALPAAGAPAVGPGLPTAAGISSPSPFPAGLPSPLPFPAGTPSSVIAAPGTGATGTPAGTTGTTGTEPNTAVMGAVGGSGAATMGSATAAPPRTAVEIIQTFNQADINRDGGLTRAEAQRIALPNAFEELDRNKDGVLSRGEYEDAF